MDKKNRIDVSSSSLVGLKAELYRKQEEFMKEKLQRLAGPLTPSTKPKQTSRIWSKKKGKDRGVSRPEKDVEQLEKERAEMERAQSILEAKTRLYEQMTSGNEIPDEQTNNLFLVDFERKQLDKAVTRGANHSEDPSSSGQSRDDEETLVPESEIPPASNPDEEWVDYTDSLGRSRRCMRKDLPGLIEMDKKLNPDRFETESAPEVDTEGEPPDLMSDDMYRERMRKKWEKEQQDLLERGQSSIHYQNVRFDEVRTHGAAYFEFAKDEETRGEQMSTLKFLRDETVTQRTKRGELKAKRKAALEARLEKVRQRKKMKTGAAGGPEVGADRGTYQGADKGTEQGTIGAAVGPVAGLGAGEKKKTEESVDPNWQRTLRLIEAAKKESRKEDREWDVAKEPKSWADQRSQVRNERLTEFAPPTNYTPSAARKKRWGHGGERDTNRNNDSREASKSTNITRTERVAHSDFVPGGNAAGEGGAEGGRAGVPDPPLIGGENRDAVTEGARSQGGDQTSRNLSGPRISGGIDVPATSSTHPGIGASSSWSSGGRRLGHIQDPLPACLAGDVGTTHPPDGGRSQEMTSAEVQKVAGGHQSSGLVRTGTSKPIKFSIGIVGRESAKEPPGTTPSCFDIDEIKEGIQTLRQQTS